jgi:inhibitor of cysteine peptidase
MFYIDDSSLNQTVYVPVGQMIELRLRENPTTGFRWSFASDAGPSCTVIGDSFEQQNGPPGAGGEHAWQIKAVRAGKCHLELFYRRPHDPDVPPAQIFTLDIQITE